MTEAAVLSIIARMGVFQINPLAYRSAEKMKVLNAMVRKGLITKQRVRANCLNFTATRSDRREPA